MTIAEDQTRDARARLDRLWSRGRAFLGTDFAIMGGAMTWVSERNLVASISNGGGFGVLASGSMSPEQLDAEITGTKGLTAKPFGVNLITMHPESGRVDRCLRRPAGRPCRSGRRIAAVGRRPAGQGDGGQGRLLRADRRDRPQAGEERRRRHRDRGDGGGRPYRAGFHIRPGSGNPARRIRRAGLRGRRHRPGRGDPVVSGDGGFRRAAWHPLRLRYRIDRPSALQAAPSSMRRRAMRYRRFRSIRAFR